MKAVFKFPMWKMMTPFSYSQERHSHKTQIFWKVMRIHRCWKPSVFCRIFGFVEGFLAHILFLSVGAELQTLLPKSH